MSQNIDQNEVNKFAAIADRWWDPTGDFKPLHVINPLRANYINEKSPLNGLKALDVGCGGGLLAEALHDRGAEVTAIDVTQANIEVAKLHALNRGLVIDYRVITAEKLAESQPESFDVVACLEVIEHVPDPGQLIAACSKLLKPGGQMFLSTLNRNPRSFITAIVGAEYIFNVLPKGTHEWSKFIKPAELEKYMRQAQVNLLESKGMFYNPVFHSASLNNDLGVNYLMYGSKNA
ncbi:MAG: bifunctional 2-polyprenyl-6-hydroxyphenol methylase/3-demethylubiquinol 3-O-methyltransferase UbiG [Gammaproteobacteria bacterium]|jgi:2-polyprenyl-6-hydroxyphenyl methylase/3-demethylubiquinone-9 3-methyltransferase|nr:bifunctional 2-polyprenyl-6-hydroxyphenol methylase/3-demethylubiquinol 3-O-methyltransferase UbiG [Gammaproteobacteria bacterium]